MRIKKIKYITYLDQHLVLYIKYASRENTFLRNTQDTLSLKCTVRYLHGTDRQTNDYR